MLALAKGWPCPSLGLMGLELLSVLAVPCPVGSGWEVFPSGSQGSTTGILAKSGNVASPVGPAAAPSQEAR